MGVFPGAINAATDPNDTRMTIIRQRSKNGSCQKRRGGTVCDACHTPCRPRLFSSWLFSSEAAGPCQPRSTAPVALVTAATIRSDTAWISASVRVRSTGCRVTDTASETLPAPSRSPS